MTGPRSAPPAGPGPDPRFDAAVLRALFGQSPMGLHILDTELRVVRFNTAAPGMRGYALDSAVGHTWAELGLEGAETVQRMLRRVLERGEPVLEYPYTHHAPHYDRPHRMYLSAYRLQEPGGEVLGVAVTVADRTDRDRYREGLQLVNDAGHRIGTSLDVFRTAQELADTAASALADLVAVEVLDAVVQGDAPGPGPLPHPLALRRAGFAHAPGVEAGGGVPLGQAWVLRPGTPHAQALADLRPRLVPRLGAGDPWPTHDPEGARQDRGPGMHSLIAAPLTARGVLLGLAAFHRTGDSPAFDEEDLAVATELAGRTALCLDNARLYTREHSLAALVRRRMLPTRLPAHSAVETAHTYLPGHASGTWYDVLPLSGARVGLVTGEVVAEGLSAVTVMGRLRAAVGALAALDLDPGELLHRLHGLTTRLSVELAPTGTAPDPLRAGCLLAIYDPVTTRCTLAAADHPPPLLLPPDGPARPVDLAAGPPLGQGAPDYPTTPLDLPKGSVLALHNSAWPPHAPRMLSAAVTRHRDAPLQTACDTAGSKLFPRSPAKDALLLLARTRRLGADRTVFWELENGPTSPAAARRLATRRLTAWGLEELAFTTELIVSELVTNAMRYAQGSIGLRLIRETALICEVSDGSSTAAHLRQAADEQEGGRGLFLVAQLATAWGTRFNAHGKTIWAEQPLPTDTGPP
ncbi:SpoIIE family protein phosphatase [Streptomyces hoynatensis]|uniref:GAF domain-containing protein n=1 Tax=Streptomyces hoynatensis TaxID=1141874 RepID=A0A3A9YW74_9ACTN|nr:SpoIIE family protein phosphatase [Streptomyces hoynatensis]RKN40039.1 GAF domain-containing protein [Streptomyces hoynatensis]